MLCEKEKCTGCMSCKNICPTGAISESFDEFGFIHPQINNILCINCGLCVKACPYIGEKLSFNFPFKAYAAVNKNNNIRNNSTSGGAATTFSIKTIENGGVVYGASVDKQLKIVHKRVDNLNDLSLLSGTKYVESYIKDAYSKIKIDLENGTEVLFVGTPCQVGGLLTFLKKKYSNLTTVSFICHGVPSQKFLHDEITNSKVINADNIRFRDNTKYVFQLFENKKLVYEKMREKCAYYRGFDCGFTLRENCYHCSYSKFSRVGDITVGDFWGLEKSGLFDDTEKKLGISLILPTTYKGLKLVESCSSVMIMEEHNLDEAKEKNPHLQNPVPKTQDVEIFRSNYIKLGFEKAVNIVCGKKYAVMLFKMKFNHIKPLAAIYRKIKNLGRVQ